MATERAAFEIAQTLDIVPFPAARRRRTLAQQPLGDRDIIDGLPLGQIDAVDVKLVPQCLGFFAGLAALGLGELALLVCEPRLTFRPLVGLTQEDCPDAEAGHGGHKQDPEPRRQGAVAPTPASQPGRQRLPADRNWLVS